MGTGREAEGGVREISGEECEKDLMTLVTGRMWLMRDGKVRHDELFELGNQGDSSAIHWAVDVGRTGGKVESPVLGVAFGCLRAVLVVGLFAARAWCGLEVECVSVGNRLHVEGYSHK